FCFEDSREIFSETFSRALIEVDPKNIHQIEELANEKELLIVPIGTVGGNSFNLCDIKMDMEKLKDIYFNSFKKVIQKDL
ncbi:MAG TPA: phosphoribosylformylglycinamidine synthase II, partial [Campylobacterales bacterium]|nr:phosphoribosylformylglycinamidine synthase II [Campylobacterales bacterium]